MSMNFKNPVDFFDNALASAIIRNTEKARSISASYLFKVTGEGGGIWLVDLKANTPEIKKGIFADADCIIEIAWEDFQKIINDPTQALALFMQGRLQISGNPMLAMKIATLVSLVNPDPDKKGTPASVSSSQAWASPINSHVGLLKSVQISNFRALQSLTLSGLCRVNLIVGTNNCGKTSLLEAIELLISGGNPRILWRSLVRRGERVVSPSEDGDFDVSHLFYGHRIEVGANLEINGSNGRMSKVRYEIRMPPIEEEIEKSATGERDQIELDESALNQRLALAIITGVNEERLLIPLTPGGGLSSIQVRRLSTLRWKEPIDSINYVGTEAFDTEKLAEMWDNIVLTNYEDRVVQALKIIEPTIERIAFKGRRMRPRVDVKLESMVKPIPIGSMGDGIKRLLLLAINLVRSANGYIFIDEIDTGLHYSVMLEMWKLVIKTAKQLNIQVFVTTHSQDCVAALACLYEQDRALATDISMHRIDRGENSTISYSAEEIALAANRQIEMRG